MPKGDILLERKNPIDKRLKEIKIAADLFEVWKINLAFQFS